MEIELECETKTVDNVFVQVKAAIQYNIPPHMAQAAYYTLEFPENQMKAYVYDAIRAKIPTMTVEEAFSSKDAVSDNILHVLSDRMGQYGFQIRTVLDRLRRAVAALGGCCGRRSTRRARSSAPSTSSPRRSRPTTT